LFPFFLAQSEELYKLLHIEGGADCIIKLFRQVIMAHPVPPVRPSPIAGTWYSGDPAVLREEIELFLARADPCAPKGEIVGLIVPHAGYRYSGSTAGFGYRCVEGRSYDVVAVVSPLHMFHPAELLTSAHKAYHTPLGKVDIDAREMQTLKDSLFTRSGLSLTEISNDNEHSLEIQLPFLQAALDGEFKLIPLMVRTNDEKPVAQLGAALGQVLKGKNALLVASTDLSHFYNEHEAGQLDREMLLQIETFSPSGVLHAEKAGTGFACGAGAVATVLTAAKALGANRVTVLHHATSADTTHDPSSVVGYGAAVITRE